MNNALLAVVPNASSGFHLFARILNYYLWLSVIVDVGNSQTIQREPQRAEMKMILIMTRELACLL